MICATCLALDFAPEDQLRALVRYQAQQIHRLTGGYEPPDPLELVAETEDDAPAPSPDAASVVESLLGTDGIFRKPGRVAAPRLIEGLAAAGLHLTSTEEAHG